jgi:uncharacterized protein (DUF427 family)
VKLELLARTDHGRHGPYQGDASYYSIASDGNRSENAAWSYEEPYDAMEPIKDHLAFYPNRVSSIEEL